MWLIKPASHDESMIFSGASYRLNLSFAKAKRRYFKLKRIDFCCQSGFPWDCEQECSRSAANKQLPLFWEQAYAWFIREPGFQISCPMIRHVAWFCSKGSPDVITPHAIPP